MAFQIFSLNDNGVVAMQQGYYAEGGRFFLQGLDSIRQILETKAPAVSDSERATAFCSFAASLTSKAIGSEACCAVGPKPHHTALENRTSWQLEQQHEDAFDFFARVFLVSASDLGQSSFDAILGAVCVLLLFNAGVAFHADGVQTGRSKMLLKAYKFYEKAVSIVQQEHPSPWEAGKLPLVYLSVLANMAHIQSELFESDALHQTQLLFENVLNCVVHRFSAALEAHELRFFLIKLMLLNCQTSIQAAAA
jgi:hypothetical protein